MMVKMQIVPTSKPYDPLPHLYAFQSEAAQVLKALVVTVEGAWSLCEYLDVVHSLVGEDLRCVDQDLYEAAVAALLGYLTTTKAQAQCSHWAFRSPAAATLFKVAQQAQRTLRAAA